MSLKAITSDKVVINQRLIPATIIYSSESGKIIEIYENQILTDLENIVLLQYDILECLNVSPNVILPGLVDSHVHLNDPGRSEWEGFETGTKSALSGGVTTVVDMPLNATPPTSNIKNLNSKIAATKNNIWCDVAFWGALIPENLDDLIPMVKAGVRGFKGFLCHSGIDEYKNIDKEYIKVAMATLKSYDTKLLFHAELIDDNHTIEDIPNDNNSKYDNFLKSRPDQFETDGIQLVIDCLKEIENVHPNFGAHIVHLASDKPLSIIEIAKQNKLPLTVETCFHYLTLTSETIPDSCTQYKCCPPIRSNDTRLLLWDALRKGLITSVVSDHSPCTSELKKLESGDFMEAWGGISSVGLNLPLIWTSGRGIRKPISLIEIVKWCCENTRKQAGVDNIKGYIKVGHDADFVVFDPYHKYIYNDIHSHFKNKLTPYHGMELSGKVNMTILRGNTVHHHNKFTSMESQGTLILNT